MKDEPIIMFDDDEKRERYRSRQYERGWRQLAIWVPESMAEELRTLVRERIAQAGFELASPRRSSLDETACFVSLRRLASEDEAAILRDAGFVNWTVSPDYPARTWAHPRVLRKDRDDMRREMLAALPRAHKIRFKTLRGSCAWDSPYDAFGFYVGPRTRPPYQAKEDKRFTDYEGDED